jgi:DNA-binding NtrC family response regulator
MSDKILIVDDEPSNRNILRQELTHRGYAVETANDGSEALNKVESTRPDLIILDYMMPDLSGLDVLRELRKKEDDTPVVLITAYGTVDRAVQAMKEGAYDFITRPFEPDLLPSCCGMHWSAKGSEEKLWFSRRRWINAII